VRASVFFHRKRGQSSRRQNRLGLSPQCPPLKLKTADGKVIPIESYRGKPVILDFWATWCGPCVASMPKLAELYAQGKEKGLVLLSIDFDQDPKMATDFWAKKGYAWPDFHDGDGAIEKLVGSSAIPRTMLIDAQGHVVYDGISGTDRLREEVAKLGPDFASLAAKPVTAPCVVPKPVEPAGQ
jgi:thiol-disulfide isomerase/thioredoxin